MSIDRSAGKSYWHEDIIEPAVEVSPECTITAPEGPGIGFEIKGNPIEKAKVRTSEVK